MSKRRTGTWWALWPAAILLATAVRGATPDAPETWDSGGIAGWTRQDPLNSGTAALANPTNYLQVVFNAQSQPSPQVHIVRADAGASGGKFVADYWHAGVTSVTFKLYCETDPPADLRLYLCNGTSDNWWYRQLDAPTVGEWTDYNVSLEYWAGWRLGIGGDAAKFRENLQAVAWVGIQIQRNGALRKQTYGLDNFVIHGASTTMDGDGDGMKDWAEFIAGTDPNDPSSYLGVEIGRTNVANGIVLRWRSVGHRTYSILRTTNLRQEFEYIASGIEATPAMNTYVDEDPGIQFERILFYKVEVQW